MAPVMALIETGDEVKEDMEDMSGDGDSSSVRLTTHLRSSAKPVIAPEGSYIPEPPEALEQLAFLWSALEALEQLTFLRSPLEG